jgi:hypothetical protein
MRNNHLQFLRIQHCAIFITLNMQIVALELAWDPCRVTLIRQLLTGYI